MIVELSQWILINTASNILESVHIDEPTPDASQTSIEYQFELLKGQDPYFYIWDGSNLSPRSDQEIRKDSLNFDRLNLIKYIEDNPSICYRIYKYLTLDQYATKNIDPTVPPHGIEYTKQLNPKLKKTNENIRIDGLQDSVIWSAFDYTTNTVIEELLKVNIHGFELDPTFENYPTGQSLLKRITDRQWILEDGTYKSNSEQDILDGISDVKRTYKVYENESQQRSEGIKRRQNVALQAEDILMPIVFIFFANQNMDLARDIGKSILRYIKEFKDPFLQLGDSSLMDELDLISSDSTVWDEVIIFGDGTPISGSLTYRNIFEYIIPDIPTTQSMMPSLIGAQVSAVLSGKYRGLL